MMAESSLLGALIIDMAIQMVGFLAAYALKVITYYYKYACLICARQK